MQDHKFIKSKDFPRACRECEYGKKYHIADTNTKTDSKPSDQKECNCDPAHLITCPAVKFFPEKPSSSSSDMTKITDTLDAKIITILSDYLEHDADAQADCSLKLLELVEEEKILVVKKTINEMSRDIYWLDGTFDEGKFTKRLEKLASTKK